MQIGLHAHAVVETGSRGACRFHQTYAWLPGNDAMHLLGGAELFDLGIKDLGLDDKVASVVLVSEYLDVVVTLKDKCGCVAFDAGEGVIERNDRGQTQIGGGVALHGKHG